MNKKQKRILVLLSVVFILVILAIIVLSKNNQEKNKEEILTNSPETQLTNPASDFCINEGGIFDIRQDEEGEVGYCMKNGKECEEWSFYRNECEL